MAQDPASCQIVEAPSSPTARLIADRLVAPKPSAEAAEIRLTYRELTELIEDALRSLR